MGMVGCFASVSKEDLIRLKDNPDQVDEYLHPDDGEGEPPFYVDVDKSWHAIHFMLAGSAEEGSTPEAQAVLGGEAVGEDAGYGPARLMSPEEVDAVARALEPLTPEVFAQRYDPKKMDSEGIYPEIWERDGQEGLDYILEFYQQLRVFYLDARERGDGAVLWLS
jgi:hypothetical protein